MQLISDWERLPCGASGGHALPNGMPHFLVGRGRPASSEYAVAGRTRRDRTLPSLAFILPRTVLLALLLIGFIPCTNAESSDDSLLIFGAASLSDALTEIARLFEESESIEVTCNFAASSMLARQIRMGAPADVFLSAAEAKMNDLERDGRLLAGTRRRLVGNQLVIVVSTGSSLQMQDARGLLDRSITRIVLADPRSVPAGIYARAYLEDAQLWESLLPRLIPAANVRAALAAVESGNADAGFVYLTDAMRSTRASICFRVPIEQGPDIAYPVAVVRRERLNPHAVRFVSFLSKPEIMQIFRSHGFLLLDDGAPSQPDGVTEEP